MPCLLQLCYLSARDASHPFAHLSQLKTNSSNFQSFSSTRVLVLAVEEHSTLLIHSSASDEWPGVSCSSMIGQISLSAGSRAPHQYIRCSKRLLKTSTAVSLLLPLRGEEPLFLDHTRQSSDDLQTSPSLSKLFSDSTNRNSRNRHPFSAPPFFPIY
jgi:hypothetical protein